jgi:hypothetical protein
VSPVTNVVQHVSLLPLAVVVLPVAVVVPHVVVPAVTLLPLALGGPFQWPPLKDFCLIHQINVESNAFMLTSRLIKFGLVHQRQRWPKWRPLSSTMANKVHTSR